MPKTVIDCTNITKTYTNDNLEYQALKGVSLTVQEGEFVAIMGPSGSGKSTLMHILGCLDKPTTGTYLLDGQDVSKMSENELAEIRAKKIGFVFQAFNLLRRTTVLRNVMLPLIYSGVPQKNRRALAEQALRSAGLADESFSHLSNQLSGGQMQRVAIARALINNPSIIFADEPTGNLDTKTGEIVMETFQRLNEENGHTIILVTHEPYIAEYAQRIIHILDGKIVSDEANQHQKILYNNHNH